MEVAGFIESGASFIEPARAQRRDARPPRFRIAVITERSVRARKPRARLAILRIESQSLMVITHGTCRVARVLGTRSVRQQRAHRVEIAGALQTVGGLAVAGIDALRGLERPFGDLYLSCGERPLAGGELRCKLRRWRALFHGI